MGWWVYVLECGDGSLYTGITNNLEKRVKDHNDRLGAKYTAGRLPVKLVWSQECQSRSFALKEELRIKSLSRVEKKLIVKSTGQ